MNKTGFFFLTFFTVLFTTFYIHAQSGKGYLLVAVKPDNAIIRLDTVLVQQKQSHQVIDSGTYIIKAWAPGRKLVVDTLHIGEGKGVLFRRKLQHTEEYKKYKTQRYAYNMTKYLPGAATIGISLYYLGQYLNHDAEAKKYLEKANDNKETYDGLTDLEEIIKYKSIYKSNKEKYDSALKRTNNVISNASIVIPSAIVITGVLYYCSRKFIKPVFNEVPLLSDLSLDYELTGYARGPRINGCIKF